MLNSCNCLHGLVLLESLQAFLISDGGLNINLVHLVRQKRRDKVRLGQVVVTVWGGAPLFTVGGRGRLDEISRDELPLIWVVMTIISNVGCDLI